MSRNPEIDVWVLKCIILKFDYFYLIFQDIEKSVMDNISLVLRNVHNIYNESSYII
jgi:hypothetical protein